MLDHELLLVFLLVFQKQFGTSLTMKIFISFFSKAFKPDAMLPKPSINFL